MGREDLPDIQSSLAEVIKNLVAENNLLKAENKRFKAINDDLMREREEDDLNGRQPSEFSLSPTANFLYTRCSFDDIVSATRNFAKEIGEGWYGKVYRGEIEGIPVAVKIRPENGSPLNNRKFQATMDKVSRIQHPNVVKVVGACSARGCILYEFMENGNLADYLHGKNDTSPLLWRDRARIATEVCSALDFLHSLKPAEMSHCNLKPTNILLDGSLASKITDIGIACLLPRNRGPENTPYINLSYIGMGKCTYMSDFYSLGFIILELLTGQSAETNHHLRSNVEQSLDDGELKCLLDRSAGWPYKTALRLARFALACIRGNERVQKTKLHHTLTKLLDVEPQTSTGTIGQATRERTQASTSTIAQPNH